MLHNKYIKAVFFLIAVNVFSWECHYIIFEYMSGQLQNIPCLCRAVWLYRIPLSVVSDLPHFLLQNHWLHIANELFPVFVFGGHVKEISCHVTLARCKQALHPDPGASLACSGLWSCRKCILLSASRTWGADTHLPVDQLVYQWWFWLNAFVFHKTSSVSVTFTLDFRLPVLLWCTVTWLCVTSGTGGQALNSGTLVFWALRIPLTLRWRRWKLRGDFQLVSVINPASIPLTPATNDPGPSLGRKTLFNIRNGRHIIY